MNVLYVLVPMALLLSGGAALSFLWATKNGQLDDLETPALRMLQDDDAPHPLAPSPVASVSSRPDVVRGSRSQG
jgi:cbb3-type cytochrome oxidase maturation protein